MSEGFGTTRELNPANVVRDSYEERKEYELGMQECVGL